MSEINERFGKKIANVEQCVQQIRDQMEDLRANKDFRFGSGATASATPGSNIYEEFFARLRVALEYIKQQNELNAQDPVLENHLQFLKTGSERSDVDNPKWHYFSVELQLRKDEGRSAEGADRNRISALSMARHALSFKFRGGSGSSEMYCNSANPEGNCLVPNIRVLADDIEKTLGIANEARPGDSEAKNDAGAITLGMAEMSEKFKEACSKIY